ncbi:MAG: hypothetical protein AB1473_12520 [Thermodesulfobacteriota bacterium]
MKRLPAQFAVMVGLWFVFTGASAQAFLGYDATPAASGLIVGSPERMGEPWDTAGRGVIGAPTLYFGWLDHLQGSRWALQRQESTGIAPWPLRGWWLGASTEFPLGNRFGALLSGSIFFPQRSDGRWFTEPVDRAFDFEVPQYDWLSLDGLAKGRICRGVEILAGFRWDHTSTRVEYSDDTRDDYVLNAYLPLIGLQIRQQYRNSCMLFRFVGTPLVRGQLRYHSWDGRGYAEFGDFDVSGGSFAELLAEYSLKFSDGLSLGAFVKWNALRANTDVQRLEGLTTDPVSWVVDIRSWTVGGSLSLGFFSPI